MSGADPASAKAVLFDLDDTLYPEHEFVDGGFRAVADLLAREASLDPETLRARLWDLHAAQGRGRLFDTLLAEIGRPEPDLLAACVVAYRTHRPRLEAFPGVESIVAQLRQTGRRLGVVSDGLASVQRAKLAALGTIGAAMEVVILTSEIGPEATKPAPIGFRVAGRLLGVSPAEIVYVGNDPRKDFRGAREAGLRTIRFGRLPDEGGAARPVHRPEDDADVIVDGPRALAEALGLPGARPGEVPAPR